MVSVCLFFLRQVVVVISDSLYYFIQDQMQSCVSCCNLSVDSSLSADIDAMRIAGSPPWLRRRVRLGTPL